MNEIMTRIELDGKIICSKPLLSDETLSSIRNKLKERVQDIHYHFLDLEGNNIETQNEDNYKLSDIINNKKIKIMTALEKLLIKIILNDKEFSCSKNISPKQNLNEVRNILKNEIKQDFIFLDSDGFIVDIRDENDYLIQDILNNNSINLKNNQNNNNIPPSNQTKFDFSKYKEIKSEEFYRGIKLYLYSEKERKSRHEGIYEYYYDEFDSNDYKEAYIIFFVGDIGTGKTLAINAFFNIIKGIKLEDEFRFILINEHGKKINISQTYGIHIYYIKDFTNKPFILIDSELFPDSNRCRGWPKSSLELIIYVFKNIIEHINAVCLTTKSSNSRLSCDHYYICKFFSGLFSEDISENLCFIFTFANNDTMKFGPYLIKNIEHDTFFSNKSERKNTKYWFAFDNAMLFDEEINSKICKYSYAQLYKFYEEIKKLIPNKSK